MTYVAAQRPRMGRRAALAQKRLQAGRAHGHVCAVWGRASHFHTAATAATRAVRLGTVCLA